MPYSDKVLDHYENPKNVGSLDKNDPSVGTGLVGAPACGDVLRLQIKVSEEGVIEDAKFKTYGCMTSNTLVNTRTKAVKMKDLSVGDTVLAWNGQNIVDQKIKNIETHWVQREDLLVITFQKKTKYQKIDSKFSLICTKNHIFWNCNDTPIEAEDIPPGLELKKLLMERTEKNAIEPSGIKIVSVEPVHHKNQLRGCERSGTDILVYDLHLEEGANVFFTNRVASHNCGSAIASSSLISEWIKGKTLEEAGQIKNQQIAEELALPPVKIHCSILAEDSIKAAIEDYRQKKEKALNANI